MVLSDISRDIIRDLGLGAKLQSKNGKEPQENETEKGTRRIMSFINTPARRTNLPRHFA